MQTSQRQRHQRLVSCSSLVRKRGVRVRVRWVQRHGAHSAAPHPPRIGCCMPPSLPPPLLSPRVVVAGVRPCPSEPCALPLPPWRRNPPDPPSRVLGAAAVLAQGPPSVIAGPCCTGSAAVSLSGRTDGGGRGLAAGWVLRIVGRECFEVAAAAAAAAVPRPTLAHYPC